jgi:hypothetical protein
MALQNKQLIYVSSVILGLICCVILLSYRYNEDCYKRYILPTKHALDVSRANIMKYKEVAGNFPEIRNGKFVLETSSHEIEYDQLPIKEYISDKKGNDNVFTELNYKGGWIYDGTTGEVRLNLMYPVKKYFRFYYGQLCNDIPSNW